MYLNTPTVLVPGLLCSAEVFASQAAALWPHGMVTIASTLAADHIGGIAAAILRDAPPRFALAGISMGGYICMEILRQAPDRVSKWALLDTSARPDTAEQTERRRDLLEQARQSDFGSWVEEVLTSIMHPSRHADASLRAINRRMGLAVGLDGLARQTEAAITRPDSRPLLPQVQIPSLVLVGAEDRLIPPEHSEEIASLIPGAELVVVPQCGHSSTLEQPDAVSAALLRWMGTR